MGNEVALFQEEIEGQRGALQSILPEHMPVERFIRAAIVAATTTPSVLQADRQSLFTALQRCASDGLIPDNREAALVEFNTKSGDKWIKKIQYMPMVDGVLKRARQSGEISVITARAVHEGDDFDYWVDENGEHLKHRPHFGSDRGKIKLVYAMAKMKSGDVIVEPMTMDDVNKVKGASKTPGSGPWVDWFERMALKSALHRLARRLPNSSEMMEMLSNDNWMYSFNKERDQKALSSDSDQDQEKGRHEIEMYSDEKFDRFFPAWERAINAGKLAQDVIDTVNAKATLSKEQKDKILAVKAPATNNQEAGNT